MREKKKKYTVDLVLENCQCLEFDPKDIYVEFEYAGCDIWDGEKTQRIKNVYIQINKDAKARNVDFENEDWKERIKIPDITHIDFGGESFSIWEYKGDWENEYQKLTEYDDRFVIEISKKNRTKH